MKLPANYREQLAMRIDNLFSGKRKEEMLARLAKAKSDKQLIAVNRTCVDHETRPLRRHIWSAQKMAETLRPIYQKHY